MSSDRAPRPRRVVRSSSIASSLGDKDTCSGRMPSVTSSPAATKRAAAAKGDGFPPASSATSVPSPCAATRAGQQIDRWAADKARGENVRGPIIEVQRRTDLLDLTLVDHDDAVRERHRLDLIVGDIDHRALQLAVQFRQFVTHLHAQLGIEIGERLVEQEDLRIADDRPTDRDPLTLATRQLMRQPIQQHIQLQRLGREGDAR